MSTREVALARAEMAAIEGQYRQATGVYRTRIEHAKARLARAIDAQNRMQQELERLIYTLEAGFGIRLGQQYLGESPTTEPRVTFIQKTKPEELRARIRELRGLLTAARD